MQTVVFSAIHPLKWIQTSITFFGEVKLMKVYAYTSLFYVKHLQSINHHGWEWIYFNMQRKIMQLSLKTDSV